MKPNKAETLTAILGCRRWDDAVVCILSDADVKFLGNPGYSQSSACKSELKMKSELSNWPTVHRKVTLANIQTYLPLPSRMQ